MNHYIVTGTIVDSFGRSLGRVSKETRAVSEAKAKANVMYQVKKNMKLNASSKFNWYKDVYVQKIS